MADIAIRGSSKEYTAVGQSHSRLESYTLVTGKADFVENMDVPGCLVGLILRSPHPFAVIEDVNVSDAEKLSGVAAVVTARDTPGVPWGPFMRDQPVLAAGLVRYVGEEIAAVAAVDLDTAREALSKIRVAYRPLKPCLTIDEALAEGAPLVHESGPGNVAHTKFIEHGDIHEAFKLAKCVVEGTFEWPLQYHAYLETIGSLAVPVPGTRKLVLYMNSWSPWMSRDELAPAIGLRPRDLRVVQPSVGGSFGGKVCDDNNAPICALLAIKAARPVRIVNTREDEFLASRPRERGKVFARLGFSDRGQIVAKDSIVWHDNGAYTGKSPAVLGVTMKRTDYNYRLRNVRSRGLLVYTNTIPSGSMRGFGNPEGVFAMESLIDMGAQELGIDPFEIRLRNAAEAGDVSIHGPRFESCELRSALETVRTMSKGDEGATPRPIDSEWRRGIGVGVVCHVAGKRHFGNWDGANALIEIDIDGAVRLVTGIGDTGSGANTVLAQIVSNALGCNLDDVSVVPADTGSGPYNHGTHASRTTYIAGNAVAVAAWDARRQLAAAAAEMLECNESDLQFEGSMIWRVSEPERRLSFEEVASGALYKIGGSAVVGIGSWDPPTEITKENEYGNESGAYSFAVQAAEVEVNTMTGRVNVVRVWSAVDCGTVINPLLAAGQVAGGIQNALGMALCEETPMDRGRPVFMNLDEYQIPNIFSMPDIEIQWIGKPEPTHAFGAKGLGELTIGSISAAIGNAIANATGARLWTLPGTPERVLAAITTQDGAGLTNAT